MTCIVIDSGAATSVASTGFLRNCPYRTETLAARPNYATLAGFDGSTQPVLNLTRIHVAVTHTDGVTRERAFDVHVYESDTPKVLLAVKELRENRVSLRFEKPHDLITFPDKTSAKLENEDGLPALTCKGRGGGAAGKRTFPAVDQPVTFRIR